MIKTLVFASDHGGFKLKQELIKYFSKTKLKVIDMGTNSDSVAVSYSEKGFELAKRIVKTQNQELGIGICGTGIGISLALNRVKKIRAARVVSMEDAKLAKLHNNANVLVFGGRQIKAKKAIKMIDLFLKTEFEGGRHIKRINRLDK